MSEMDVKEDTTVADFEWPGLFISIVPRITGSLSVVSSSTIIFLIYRSDAKLTTIYHRIMFCMSICDIIGSTAMTLTTIPMPKEMPLEQELGFEWPGGNRYGNTLSCNLQGFSFTFGTLTMFGLNAMLCFCKYLFHPISFFVMSPLPDPRSEAMTNDEEAIVFFQSLVGQRKYLYLSGFSL